MHEFSKFFVVFFFLIIYFHRALTIPEEYGDKNETSNFLIVGGYRPKEHTWVKYMVRLERDGHSFCAGTIIAEKLILTAGHCLLEEDVQEDPSIVSVVAGSPYRLTKLNSSAEYEIKKIIIHENFGNPKSTSNDIALIKLKEKIEWNDWVQKIKISDHDPKINSKCTAAGWGRLFTGGPKPNEVLYVDFTVKSFWLCQKKSMTVNKLATICVSGEDNAENACLGDSGGPLFCENSVAGVTSFTIYCELSVAVYTNVYYYKDWIEENGSISDRIFSSKLQILLIIVLFIYNKFWKSF